MGQHDEEDKEVAEIKMMGTPLRTLIRELQRLADESAETHPDAVVMLVDTTARYCARRVWLGSDISPSWEMERPKAGDEEAGGVVYLQIGLEPRIANPYAPGEAIDGIGGE